MVFRDSELFRLSVNELSDVKAVILGYDWRDIYRRENP